jgi:hypothetical protein
MPHKSGISQELLTPLEDTHMAEDTPKSKEEMEKALKDLQLDPDDLDAVVGGTGTQPRCVTCYSQYTVNGLTTDTPAES